MTASKILGDISLGLMIFSLGVRLSSASFGAWSIGVVGAIATPLTGMLVAWAYGTLAGLNRIDQDILFIFGALPPAVSNFIFAERYNQEPEKVASIVMIGNASALLFIPLALALRL
jgi:predicted permease